MYNYFLKHTKTFLIIFLIIFKLNITFACLILKTKNYERNY